MIKVKHPWLIFGMFCGLLAVYSAAQVGGAVKQASASGKKAVITNRYVIDRDFTVHEIRRKDNGKACVIVSRTYRDAAIHCD